MQQRAEHAVPWLKSRKNLIRLISILGVILIAIGCAAWTILGAQNHITISIDGETTNVQTYEESVAVILAENNISLAENDVIDIALDDTVTDGQTIHIQRAKDFQIDVDGEQIQVNMVADNVEEAIVASGITLGENDIVEPAREASVTDNMVIDIDRVVIEEVVEEKEIAFVIERRRDSSMSIYDEKVVQEGQPGLLSEVYRITYREGEIISKELVSTEKKDPVNEVVVTGSYDVASRNGQTADSAPDSQHAMLAPNGMPCTKVLNFKATAYTYDGTKTASGTECRLGAVAVDPRVIPLGTKLYVEGYGYCVAEDTGGLIKGNRIDVYLNSESECYTWGVKNVKVYVLAD